MSERLLEVTDLSVTLGRSEVLSRVSLAANVGEFVAVIGPNGSGKTTLLRAIAGLIPAHGLIAFRSEPLTGMRLRQRARAIAYLPQGNVFHWPLSVAEVVGLGRLPQLQGAGLSEEDRAAVHAAMVKTDTLEFAARPVTTLFVVNAIGVPVGILHVHDLLRAGLA